MEEKPRALSIQCQRARLNNLPIAAMSGFFIFPMVAFWMPFLIRPLRPFDFTATPPPWWIVLLCLAASFSPVLLSQRCLRPRNFERGQFYPRLGILWFRFLATDGDLINRLLRRNYPGYRVIPNRLALREHIRGTYPTERYHLVFFLIGISTTIFALKLGWYVWAVLLTLTNVVFNLLPAMNQRFKRARARKVMASCSAV